MGLPIQRANGWWEFPHRRELPPLPPGQTAKLGYHGTKMQALYSILYHGRLAASTSGEAGQAEGCGVIGKNEGVYFMSEEKKDKALHYSPWVEIFYDGVAWRVVLLVESRGPTGGKSLGSAHPGQWVQPNAADLYIRSFLVQSIPVGALVSSNDWLMLEPWTPNWEFHPLKGYYPRQHPNMLPKGVKPHARQSSTPLAGPPLEVPDWVWTIPLGDGVGAVDVAASEAEVAASAAEQAQPGPPQPSAEDVAAQLESITQGLARLGSGSASAGAPRPGGAGPRGGGRTASAVPAAPSAPPAGSYFQVKEEELSAPPSPVEMGEKDGSKKGGVEKVWHPQTGKEGAYLARGFRTSSSSA
jgi:hypothetical protein